MLIAIFIKSRELWLSGSCYSRVFIAILKQLSQYPHVFIAISLVKIRGVPKSGLLVVLGGSAGVFGLPLGTFWAPFGLPWAPFGLLWEALGIPWGCFGTTLTLLRGTLNVFDRSFGCVGTTLGNVLTCLMSFNLL